MKKNIILSVIAVILVALSVLITVVVCNRKTADLESSHEAALESMQADADALQKQLQLAENEQQANKEILIDMIRRVDYKNQTVYVIGHQTPDSDTVGSAIGMAYFLNSIGISAEARIAGDLNLEGQYVFSEVNHPIPGILEDASGKQLWLVDHSASTQMVNGAENARIVGITDHHGIGNAETTDLICVLSCPAGSTCAVVYKLCELCGVELPKNVAGILLAGVISDTSNMKSSAVTKLDERAFDQLKKLSGITDTDGLFAGMLETKLSFKGLNDTGVFYSDYKNYEHNGVSYGIGCVKVASADFVAGMAERMQKVIKSEMENGCDADFIMYSVYDVDYSVGYIGIVGKDSAFVAELMENAFGAKSEKQGEYYVFKPSLSRKKDVVPPIDEYLDTLS